MWWKFTFPNSQDYYLHITYGMSGGWFTSPTKHTAFIVEYDDVGESKKIFFNDPRHFGTLKFVSSKQEHEKKLASLGPCILSGGLTSEIFARNILDKPNRTISEALMDQSVISGVGNYLKAEVLYRSEISPWRSVTDITANEYQILAKNVVDVALQSYRSQGATISTYRTPDGSKGTTQFDFLVYSKKACPKDHPVIRDETPDGRTSHWCVQCQK